MKMRDWFTWLVKGERKASREEVVKCFLEADFQKDDANCDGYRKSPVGEWTRKDKRGEEVREWVLRKGVPIEECWTAGIKPALEEAVNEVDGNLSQLAESKRPKVIEEFGEFEDRKMPNRNNRTLIGLLREKKGKKEGKIQLIDGAHRLVAMSSKGAQKTKMYLGKLTEKSHRERGTSDPEPPKPPKHDF